MWLALTLTSFIAFLASMLLLTRRGFASDGKIQRAAGFWIALAAFSAFLWAFSLSRVPPPYSMEKTRRYEAPHFDIPAKRS